MIDNPSEVYQDVKETFRLRHIYCHEIAFSERVDVSLITRCFVNSTLFLKAADQLIWNLVAPNAPLTQSAMNAEAFQDFERANKQLEELYGHFNLYLDDDEKREFTSTQDAWTTFRDLAAKSYANRWGTGGTIWPTLNSRERRTLTLLRIEELRRELERLEKQRSHLTKRSG